MWLEQKFDRSILFIIARSLCEGPLIDCWGGGGEEGGVGMPGQRAIGLKIVGQMKRTIWN